MGGSTGEQIDKNDEDNSNGGSNFSGDIDNKATEIIKMESLIVAGPTIIEGSIIASTAMTGREKKKRLVLMTTPSFSFGTSTIFGRDFSFSFPSDLGKEEDNSWNLDKKI